MSVILTRQAEVFHLGIRHKINLGSSWMPGMCSSHKVKTKWQTGTMTVTQPWRRKGTRGMKGHLDPGWVRDCYSPMMHVTSWTGFTNPRYLKSKARQVRDVLDLGS